MGVFAQPRVLVVGSMSCDVTAFADRLPVAGETLLGTDVTMMLGGKGANQALAAARAGARTSLVGCVGTDLFRPLVLDTLMAEGVETSLITEVDGPTGIAHIRVDASAENDIVVIPLANARLTPELVRSRLEGLSRGDVVLIQLEIPFDAAFEAARCAHDAGATVILDPAPSPSQGLEEQWWTLVDIVTPNETEARILTGITVDSVESATRAGQWFVERGVRWAMMTLAGSGSVVVTSEGATHYPSFVVEAVDTTAAGDAFAGALGAALAEGQSIEDALRMASAAGALAVTVRGASSSIPDRKKIDSFLASQAL